MLIDIVSIFPGMFDGPFGESIIKHAVDKDLLRIKITDPRVFATGRHRQVDDTPFGGGMGMVLKPEPLFAAVEFLTGERRDSSTVALLSPRGRVFDQGFALELSRKEHLILICGHYEGVDERVREGLIDEDISIGDYILTGGEIPAMVVVDALARLLPGVLPHGALEEESFTGGLLEYPQYTRPRVFNGMGVPEVLLSGDHGKIREWRRRQSLVLTWKRRPELLSRADLSPQEEKLIKSGEQPSCNGDNGVI